MAPIILLLYDFFLWDYLKSINNHFYSFHIHLFYICVLQVAYNQKESKKEMGIAELH